MSSSVKPFGVVPPWPQGHLRTSPKGRKSIPNKHLAWTELSLLSGPSLQAFCIAGRIDQDSSVLLKQLIAIRMSASGKKQSRGNTFESSQVCQDGVPHLTLPLDRSFHSYLAVGSEPQSRKKCGYVLWDEWRKAVFFQITVILIS